ncbi:xanthine dehydrogenase family protein molybdopterin-binding subunit [Sphingobium amiense]|nr:molybdopterin cofactor-binding domain-containing protein [Sphingobium amiense]
MTRRQFVLQSVVLGGGLAIGMRVLPESAAANVGDPAAGDIEMSAWLAIAPTGTVILQTPKGEAGNGTNSSMVLYLSEELGCDPTKVKLEPAQVRRDFRENKVYSRPGGHETWFAGRSNELREVVQQVGASARERLKAAAAAQWNVPAADLVSKDNAILDPASGRRLGYGELAAAAAAITLSKEPAIKPPSAWTLMGKRSVKQLNAASKVDGSGIYGIDFHMPGMLYAAVRHAPVQGARLRSFDAAAVNSMPGVVTVIALGPEHDTSTPVTFQSRLRAAVVVVADHYWNARKALDALPVEWDEGDLATASSTGYRDQYLARLDTPGKVAKSVGDVPAAMKTARTVVEATYESPYLEHAPMEPLNATAHVTADRVDLWLSTQQQENARMVAAEESGLSEDRIFVHPMMVGGQFGRRNHNDEVRQAVAVAKAVGRPVKLIWAREEMMRQGRYRPNAITKFQAGLGPDGLPTAWFVRQAGHSFQLQQDPNFTGFDVIAMRPLSTENEYSIDNILVEFHPMVTNVMAHSFRGSGAGFQLESFVDEVAHAGGTDPVELRRWLLRNAKDPGWLKVLNEVAEKADWGKPLPKGRAQGIAIILDHGNINAQIAEVSVTPQGDLTVHSIDVAFDCGHVINPDGVRAQMEGGILFGLSNALHEEITIEKGRVVQGNFDDYPLLRINEACEVRVHFGGNSGGDKCAPCGEAPVPPVTPAVCNAIFRATGKRVRSFPLSRHDLRWS